MRRSPERCTMHQRGRTAPQRRQSTQFAACQSSPRWHVSVRMAPILWIAEAPRQLRRQMPHHSDRPCSIMPAVRVASGKCRDWPPVPHSPPDRTGRKPKLRRQGQGSLEVARRNALRSARTVLLAQRQAWRATDECMTWRDVSDSSSRDPEGAPRTTDCWLPQADTSRMGCSPFLHHLG